MTRPVKLAAGRYLTPLLWLVSGPCFLQPSLAADKLTYHVNAARSGWNAEETLLTPANVASPRFGLLWSTPSFDSFEATPPRLFATPLYVSSLKMVVAGSRPQRLSVIYAASATGFVYAINARTRGSVRAGAQIWRQQLTTQPCRRGSLGLLSTPVIDLRRQRLYVGYCDETALWQAAALDLRDGRMLTGWPVRLDAEAINAPGINRNGDNRFPATFAHVQRSALNLSPDGSRLYVSFGGEPTSGWMLALDTLRARIASAFSATRKTAEGVGGMWAAGGPAVDRRGHVYMSTGSSVLNTLANMGIAGVFPDSPGNWGQSIIELTDSSDSGLTLAGTYTPFNYCQAGSRDMDLGASSPVLIDLEPTAGTTPHLLALGGAKQGNAYLLDRVHLPGSLTQRQGCSDDASSDRSLLAPEPQPQFGARGPLNIFGPYTERDGMGDQARSRTTLAHFRNAQGSDFLFVTGSSKAGAAQNISAAPSLARLQIVSHPGQPPYLRLDRSHGSLILQNPGSPVVSSRGARNAIVWILDINKPRSASLYGLDAPQPVLYAIDAQTLQLLWRSRPGELAPGGKYNEATVVDGMVIVGTDRIQVFGLDRPGIARQGVAPVAGSPAPVAASAPATAAISDADLTDGRRLYTERCRVCHESNQSGVPPLDRLNSLKSDVIVEKLLLGSMQTQALGLTERQIGLIALYLSRQPHDGADQAP